MTSALSDYQIIANDVRLGRDVQIRGFVNLYGCEIGDETKIGTFVEIQKGAKIGARCKISSHTFICEGVTIEAEVFIGHGVTFINDRYPRATNARWRASNRSRLGLSADPGQARRLDRLRRDTSRRNYRGRKCDRRCGQRCHQRRPSEYTVAGNPARAIANKTLAMNR